MKRAWCFFARTWYSVSENSHDDVEQAWRVAQSARTAPPQSRLATYLLHQLMASLFHLHDRDFAHSVDEARAAMAMAPYKTVTRSDLANKLANAGDVGEAIA